MLAAVRRVFEDGKPRARDVALRELAKELGYERLGPTIRATLAHDLLAAVRRGIVEPRGDQLRLLCRSIDDYERGFLKEQFVAAVGRTWIDREEAPRVLARWLGFTRTGSAIQASTRSLITGLLRENRLEAKGRNIRRV